MTRLAILLLVLLWSTPAAAQVAREARDGPTTDRGAVFVEKSYDAARVTFSLDRDTVPIVDQVKAVLAVEAPPWILVTFPRVVDEIGSFKLIREEKAGPFNVPGEGTRLVRNERRYYLDPNEAGEVEIRALTLNLLDGRTVPSIACVYLNECRAVESNMDSSPQTAFMRIGPLPLEVTSVLPPDADITKPKDILGPVPLPPPPPVEINWQPLVLAAAAVLVLAAATVWLWRRLSRTPAPRPVPTESAHTLALAALRRLDARNLDTPEKIERFYVRVSSILRHYLDWRFELRAAHRTTEEVLHEAAARDSVSPHGGMLGGFLGFCDRVKFAAHRPNPQEPAAALNHAMGFIRDTANATARVPVARAAEVA